MKDRIARKTNRAQDLAIAALDGRIADAEGGLADLVRDVDNRLTAAEQRIAALEAPTPPPVPPDPDLPLVATLDRVSKWSAADISAPGASITDQPDGSIRLYQPSNGERCELTAYRPQDGAMLSRGSEALYAWEVMIPTLGPLTTFAGSIVCQQHGNNQAGYTGGIDLVTASNRLLLRVKGGRQISTGGSHRYEYESDRGAHAAAPGALEFGTLVRGQWHRIEAHYRWSDEWDGFARARLDGGPWAGVENVPTASEVSSLQMTRVGWYPRDGEVRPGGIEMFVRNFRVYGR